MMGKQKTYHLSPYSKLSWKGKNEILTKFLRSVVWDVGTEFKYSPLFFFPSDNITAHCCSKKRRQLFISHGQKANNTYNLIFWGMTVQLSAQNHNFYFYSKRARPTQSFLPHTPTCLHVQRLLLQPLHVWFWRCGKRPNHSEYQSLTAVPAIQWASPPWACPHSIYKGWGGIFRAAEGATILNTDTPSDVGAQPPPRQMATGHQNTC